MDGRTRTVTIADARVISRVQALDVARRVLVRAQVGENPADVLMSTRRVPRFDAFLSEFWGNVSPLPRGDEGETAASIKMRLRLSLSA